MLSAWKTAGSESSLSAFDAFELEKENGEAGGGLHRHGHGNLFLMFYFGKVRTSDWIPCGKEKIKRSIESESDSSGPEDDEMESGYNFSYFHHIKQENVMILLSGLLDDKYAALLCAF